LEAMGPVNLDAITEYDELEQRHTFLDTQQNDMLTAKEQLLSTITHINQTTRKLFTETFDQVKANFQEMFTELFGGGKATLVLQDESDPLECGIDIVARPPGKQLQSVLLLSGGERTQPVLRPRRTRCAAR
jgi:chromosome segregation protein